VTEAQREAHAALRSAGAAVVVAYGLDDAIDHLERWKLVSVVPKAWKSKLSSNVTEIMKHVPTAPPVTRSAAAERMRAHRQRRRDGLRCLMIELRETEIDVLIRKELLKPETRNNPTALRAALYAFLDGTLGAMP
jgi:hypothetical protein